MPITRPLIRPDACHRCKFAAGIPGGKLQCRRYPPSAAVFPTGSGKFVTTGDFPPTQPDNWCGEYVPRIEVQN